MSAGPLSKTLEQALTLHQRGELSRARRLYLEVLRLVPDHPDTLHMLGNLEAQDGHLNSAERLLRKAVARQPGNGLFLTTLGRVQRRAGKAPASVRSLRAAVSAAPALGEAWFALGQSLKESGRDGEAADAFRRLVGLDPGHARGYNELGLVLGRSGDTAAALAAFEHAIRADPDYSWAHNNLGVAHLNENRLAQAQRCFENALRSQPQFVAALDNLALVLRSQGRLDEALACHDQAVALAPRQPGSHAGRGVTLQGLGRYDAARAAYEKALAIEPGHGVAVAGLAELDEWEGRYQAGLDRLAPALESDPAPICRIAAARLLRRLGRPREGLDKLAPLVDPTTAAAAQMSADLKRQLAFTLGDLNDAVDEYGAAYDHYARANAMKAAVFDPAMHQRSIDALIRFFDAPRMAALPRALGDSDQWIFVVGMPRSGTTLVERILDAHPLVHGAGEQPLVGQIVAGLGRSAGSGGWPDCLDGVSRDTLDRLAREYDAAIGVSPNRAARVVDKMPLNFLHLGLIELLFPDARIIHCVRDPADTCLSCFCQDFIDPALAFSFSQQHLAAWHHQYRRLMAHWRSVLSLDRLEVSYEEMVADAETTSRRMVAFLGLQWDPACLEFHGAHRTHHTASHAQVRKPVYSTSVGRHRHYKPWIGPLLKGLADDGGP